MGDQLSRRTHGGSRRRAAALALSGLCALWIVPARAWGEARGAPPASSAARPAGLAPPATADALFTAFTAAFLAEDAPALRALLASSDLRFRLEPPGSAGPQDDAALYSAAQVFYMLERFFARTQVEEARSGRRPLTLSAGDVHGVVEVTWTAEGDSARVDRRLYVGARRQSDGWRVVEVRALP